jgi:hypothetical protein
MSQCDNECTTTQEQAINYMNNELLWAQLIVAAWLDQQLFKQMQTLASQGLDANQFLLDEAQKRNLPLPSFPQGVQTRIVVDTANVVHLVMPAVENIPARSVDMVPHAL